MKHSKAPPGKYLWLRLFKTLPSQALMTYRPPPSFSKFGTEGCPPAERGADTVIIVAYFISHLKGRPTRVANAHQLLKIR